MKRCLCFVTAFIIVCNSFAQDKIKSKTELIYDLYSDSTHSRLYRKIVSDYDTSGREVLVSKYEFIFDTQNPPYSPLYEYISEKEQYFYSQAGHKDSGVLQEYLNTGELVKRVESFIQYDSLQRYKKIIQKIIRQDTIVNQTEFSYKDSSADIFITYTKDSIPEFHLEDNIKKIDFFGKDKLLIKTIETISRYYQITTTKYLRDSNVLIKEIYELKPHHFNPNKYYTVTEKYAYITGSKKIVSSIESKEYQKIPKSYAPSTKEYYSYSPTGNLIEKRILVNEQTISISKFEYQYW